MLPLTNWDYIRDLGRRVGIGDGSVDAIIRDSRLPNRKELHSHGPLLYQDYLYAIVRILRPEYVLETGVRYGVGTTHILAALARNEKGHLISCDPMHADQLEAMRTIHEYCNTPMALFQRWRYLSTRGMEMLASKEVLLGIQTIDLFVHDSDHSFGNMTNELKLAKMLLDIRSTHDRPTIVCDDWNWIENGEANLHKDGGPVETFCRNCEVDFAVVGTAAVIELPKRESLHGKIPNSLD